MINTESTKGFFASPEGKVVTCVVVAVALWGLWEHIRAQDRKEALSSRMQNVSTAESVPVVPPQISANPGVQGGEVEIPHTREKPPIRVSQRKRPARPVPGK